MKKRHFAVLAACMALTGCSQPAQTNAPAETTTAAAPAETTKAAETPE